MSGRVFPSPPDCQRPGSAASVTRTQYDDAGRVVYTMGARGSVTGFGYDGAGRRVSATNFLSYAVNPPASGSLVPDNTTVVFVTQYGYDGNGNQVWVAAINEIWNGFT